jgi:hypothetical protein
LGTYHYYIGHLHSPQNWLQKKHILSKHIKKIHRKISSEEQP